MTATPPDPEDLPLIEPWALSARELIRDTLARYTWSGDALRVEDLTLAFCEDGVLEVRGQAPVEGRSAIAAFIGAVGHAAEDRVGSAEVTARTPRIVRHNLTNVRFTTITPTAVQVESYFTVLTEIGLDHYGRYRDTFVPVGDQWLIRHRFVSTDWRSRDSTMAPPEA